MRWYQIIFQVYNWVCEDCKLMWAYDQINQKNDTYWECTQCNN